MTCVGCRCGLDPALLWLWRKLAATALIPPLAWEAPYTEGVALKRQKKKKKKRKRKSLSSHCEAYVSLCSFASDLLMFL